MTLSCNFSSSYSNLKSVASAVTNVLSAGSNRVASSGLVRDARLGAAIRRNVTNLVVCYIFEGKALFLLRVLSVHLRVWNFQ